MRNIALVGCLLIYSLISCDKFEWYNPYDPECPKELFTPSSPGATMEGNSIRLIWTQENDYISGFALFRSADGESITNLTQTQKSTTQYLDANFTPGKRYTYYIVAVAGTNKSDTVKAEIVPVIPVSVSTGAVTEIAATSSKVSGNISNAGGGTVTSRGICWSTTPIPTVNSSKTTEGTGAGEFTSTLTNLLAGTTYYARAYGENSRGIVYGSQITFTTPKDCFDLETGFNDNVTSILTQPDGKILIGGVFTTYKGISFNRIIRLNPDGSIDNTFNIGTGFNDYVRHVKLQSNGKILVCGDFTTYNGVSKSRIVRLNSDGSIDNTFNFNLYGVVTDIGIQSDGKILISGLGKVGIVRVNADGTIDNTFSLTGFITTPEIVDNILILSNGKILVGISHPIYGFVRLNADGSKDATFVEGTANGFVEVIKLQSDGKILLGGHFGVYNGFSSPFIIRLNLNGSIDNTFNIGAGFNGPISPEGIFIQSDGKILVGGQFTAYDGVSSNGLVRINSNGFIDNAFNIGTGFNNHVSSINMQSNNFIYVGGSFTEFNGMMTNKLTKIKLSGELNNCIIKP
jgi:uncharacterized delta-60 repeat protein